MSTAQLLAYLLLAGAAIAYCSSNLLLASGSEGGITEAVRRPVYLAGTVAQAVGFGLAFAARRELPLLVVQSGVTASLALTAVVAGLLGRRRLHGAEIGAVLAVVAGLGLAASGALPGPAVDPGTAPLLGCLLALLLSAAALVPGLFDRAGVPAPIRPAVQGVAAGVAFGASAVGARVAVGEILGNDLGPAALGRLMGSAVGLMSLLLVLAGTLLGQVLLTAALSSGALTGPLAAMHVLETAGPAAVGVTLLGDRLVPGRAWAATAGVLLAAFGSIRLAGRDAAPAPAPPAVIKES